MTRAEFEFWTKGCSFRTCHARYWRLGVSQQRRLPAEGTDVYPLMGVSVWVKPLETVKVDKPNTRKPHRLMASCPHCMITFSAGRMHQHLPRCPKLVVLDD